MEFKAFNSIENTYRTAYLKELQHQHLCDGTFVVQEKVHGANFSFWLTDNTLRTAKRTSFIDDPKEFFPCDSVVRDLEPKIRALAAHFPNQEVVVFGELFGGMYNHDAVTPIKNLSPVQRGIYYAPDLHFYAFDIRIDGEYLAVSESNRLFEEAGIFYARTLFSGTLAECLAYPNDFQSHIPEWLGLPLIEMNQCEGTVIRPNEPRRQPNGSRVILKNKNETWRERNQVKPLIDALTTLSPEAETLTQELLALVTENRLANVLSKMGPVTPKDFGRLMGLLGRDVMDEFDKDHAATFADLQKFEQKHAKKQLNAALTTLVKNRLKDAVAGLWP